MKNNIYRILDANCNRFAEGTRVLEDIARFALDHDASSKQLKKIRHTVIREISKIGLDLNFSRDSEHDVGAGKESFENKQDFISLVTANSRRAQEALRVIEEISKLSSIKNRLNTLLFKNTRYSIYSIEQDLISRLSRQEKTARIKGLYAIIDTASIQHKKPEEVAIQIIQGGAKIIQLRDKSGNKRKILATAKLLHKICSNHEVLFIINDFADIARIINADGIHIGQEDLPVMEIRKIVSPGTIIGCSVDTPAQAKKAITDGADYVAVGAIFPTESKQNIETVGINRIKEIRRSVKAPLVAIGGINQSNINKVFSAGADSAAVISALLKHEDIEDSIKKLINAIKRTRRPQPTTN
jgi:thiamine-phosphate pyrophosphorylase